MFRTGESTSSDLYSKPETGEAGHSLDELYDVFANKRRRYAAHYLQQVEGQADLGEIAEQIAAWEYKKDIHQVTSDERKYVYSALQQRHLPKMHDIGLIEFDKRDATVEPTAVLDEIDVYAEVVESGDVPWGVYFPILALVQSVLLTSAGFDLALLTVFSDFEWAFIFVFSSLVSSLAFLYDTRRMRLGGSGAPPEVKQR